MMRTTRIERAATMIGLAAIWLSTLAAASENGRVRSLGDDDATLVGRVPGAELGFDVEPAGDVDGDGYDDLIAGAWHDSDAGTDAGAAYLLYGSGSEARVAAMMSSASPSGPPERWAAGLPVSIWPGITPAGTTASADSCPAHHHVPAIIVGVPADTRTGLPG